MPSPQESAKFEGLSSSRMPLAERYGMTEPSRIYPLYETASQAEWGQSPGEAHRRSADLWAQYARVAQDNPFAWIRSAPNKEMIGTPGPDNRLINWPYTKLMVANPSVNLASAFIVTSLAEARAGAIPDEDLIFIIGGAAANECDHFLERDSFRYSRAQEAVLERAAEIAGGLQAIAHMELYSCFPVVPKMAQRTLGKHAYNRSPTVTGGLTFFGAPLHNYMSHAVCAMVRALRSDGEGVGLLYGQGGHMTKHHAVILSRTPPQNELSTEFSVQSTADARRAPAPLIRNDYCGPADVEAYTVHYDRDGRPVQGVVILLTPAGERTIARVPIEDAETLAVLESSVQSAVGQTGQVSIAADGDATWRANATHLKGQAA